MNEFDLNDDVEKAIQKYNLLKWDREHKKLEGSIELKRDDGYLFQSFDVRIEYPAFYPHCFPNVTETSGLIPWELDRHVFPRSGHLCLAVQADEIDICAYGITTSKFLDKILVPRLADEFRVMNGLPYLKEYSHDNKGNWEYYFQKFNTQDTKLVIDLMIIAISGALPGRETLCPCGNNKSFARCHRKYVFNLQSLISKTGSEFWKAQVMRLVKLPYK